MNRFFDKIPYVSRFIPGKITLSFLMLLFAITLGLISKTPDRLSCLMAMCLSFLGDIALNHNPDHAKQSKSDFIIGGTAFIIAHLLYSFSYYQKINFSGYAFLNHGSIFVVSFLVMMSIMLIAIKCKHGGISKLFLFGMAYLWITGINYTTIFSYAASVRSIESIAAFGGALFFISDLIIGLEKFFGLKSKLARELVWWFYPIGQIIIIAVA